MRAVVWSDYLCPWCYVAQRRSAQLEARGVSLDHLPYELHPEVPPQGRPLRMRPGGRTEATYTQLGEVCAAEGLPFRRPTALPNTRRALELAETVRRRWPAAFPALHADLFTASFADGLDLGDRGVLDGLLAAVGLDPVEVGAAAIELDAGRLVDEAKAAALELGVTGTPAWLLDGRLLVPGLQDPAFYDRVVTRLAARPAG